MDVQKKMSLDFLTGFESGLFLRNNKEQFDEYGCQGKIIESAEVSMFKQAFAPMKMMTQMLNGGKPL